MRLEEIAPWMAAVVLARHPWMLVLQHTMFKLTLPGFKHIDLQPYAICSWRLFLKHVAPRHNAIGSALVPHAFAV